MRKPKPCSLNAWLSLILNFKVSSQFVYKVNQILTYFSELWYGLPQKPSGIQTETWLLLEEISPYTPVKVPGPMLGELRIC